MKNYCPKCGAELGTAGMLGHNCLTPTNTPTSKCCEKCWGWPANKTQQEGYCTHMFCKCHKNTPTTDSKNSSEKFCDHTFNWKPELRLWVCKFCGNTKEKLKMKTSVSPDTTDTNSEDWEQDFDAQFTVQFSNYDWRSIPCIHTHGEAAQVTPEAIKSFIRSQLQQAEARVWKEAEVIAINTGNPGTWDTVSIVRAIRKAALETPSHD